VGGSPSAGGREKRRSRGDAGDPRVGWPVSREGARAGGMHLSSAAQR
jgi:hypothetical protein